MGTGASKHQRSTVVSGSQQPTRINNRSRRPSGRVSKEEPEYVLLPGIKKERLRFASHHTPLDGEVHQQSVLGATPAAASSTPAENSHAVPHGTPARDRQVMEKSSPESTSSYSSSKSVSEELDNLRTELDQVLVGHYYASNNPAAGVLRTAEIAVLERHNQLQPLPLDYQPVIGNKTRDGQRNSDWLRPVDLVRQERDLIDRKRREEEEEEELMAHDTTKEEEEKKEEMQSSSVVVFDLEDEQDRGDFDVQKFQAVNVPKEPIAEGIDVFSQSTYKNYSATIKKPGTSPPVNTEPRTSGIADVRTKQIYDPSEEELLRSIEQDFI